MEDVFNVGEVCFRANIGDLLAASDPAYWLGFVMKEFPCAGDTVYGFGLAEPRQVQEGQPVPKGVGVQWGLERRLLKEVQQRRIKGVHFHVRPWHGVGHYGEGVYDGVKRWTDEDGHEREQFFLTMRFQDCATVEDVAQRIADRDGTVECSATIFYDCA